MAVSAQREPYQPDERRPRSWAAGILAGRDSIERVPEHLVGMVSFYLRDPVQQWADVVCCGSNREERAATLATAPEGFRSLVRAEVVRRFEAKK